MRFLVAVLYSLREAQNKTHIECYLELPTARVSGASYTYIFISGFMMTSSKWKIFRLLAICAGKSPVSGEFPEQRPVTRCLGVFLSTPEKCRVKNGEAGDLGRHHAHYDVIVMLVNNCYNEIFFRLCMKLYFKLTDEHIWSVLHN